MVNNHFGKAKQFYIYQVQDDKQQFVKIRTMTPVCTNGSHKDKKLMENLQKLSDCRYLLVSRIGAIAANAAESIGIECYEIPGMIEESIEQLNVWNDKERIISKIQDLEYATLPKVLFLTDQYEINKAIREEENEITLLVGSSNEREIFMITIKSGVA